MLSGVSVPWARSYRPFHSLLASASATWILAICLACTADPALGLAEERLLPIDGESLSATLDSIESNGTLRSAQGALPVTLNDLQAIEPIDSQPAAPKGATCLVSLVGGGNWPASDVVSDGDQLALRSAIGDDTWKLPVDSVRSIYFGKGKPPEEIAGAPLAEFDRVFVTIDGKVQSLTGLFDRLTATQLSLEFEKQPRMIDRKQVVAIVFAGAPRSDPPKFAVSLGNDIRLGASEITLATGVATLSMVGGGKITLPWKQITKLDIRSSRVTFLSDMKPVEVREETLVAPRRVWQRNRSITGAPMQIGSQVFSQGIGAQAGTRLTFETGGGYTTFAANLGIDASAEGRGDCEFVVLGDGRELARLRFRGSDASRPLRLDISGKKQISLVVEPGADLDLSDHADWANARFIKAESPPR